MTNIQLLKDELGTPLFAVVPYKEYLDLLKAAVINMETAPVSEITEIPLPYSGGHSLDVIQIAEFCHRLHQRNINSIPIDARNEVLEKLMKRYQTPESKNYPGLDALIRLHSLPVDSPYRNTRQAVREVMEALENTGVFTLTRESFPLSYRPINALHYNPVAGLAYLKYHNALDANGNSTLQRRIPDNALQVR